MRVSKAHVKNLLVALLWLMLAGGAVSNCALTGIRAVAPSNAPSDSLCRQKRNLLDLIMPENPDAATVE